MRSPRSSYVHRCAPPITPTDSGRCTPRTTAPIPAMCTSDGRARPGPGPSTRPTPNCEWTCRPSRSHEMAKPPDPAFPDLTDMSEGEAAALVRRLLDELSARGTHQAFAELL